VREMTGVPPTLVEARRRTDALVAAALVAQAIERLEKSLDEAERLEGLEQNKRLDALIRAEVKARDMDEEDMRNRGWVE